MHIRCTTIQIRHTSPPRCQSDWPPVHIDGFRQMAETAEAQPSRLMLSPEDLQKALVKSALQARRMAEAFGVKVPYAKEPLVSKKRSVEAPAIKF